MAIVMSAGAWATAILAGFLTVHYGRLLLVWWTERTIERDKP